MDKQSRQPSDDLEKVLDHLLPSSKELIEKTRSDLKGSNEQCSFKFDDVNLFNWYQQLQLNPDQNQINDSLIIEGQFFDVVFKKNPDYTHVSGVCHSTYVFSLKRRQRDALSFRFDVYADPNPSVDKPLVTVTNIEKPGFRDLPKEIGADLYAKGLQCMQQIANEKQAPLVHFVTKDLRFSSKPMSSQSWDRTFLPLLHDAPGRYKPCKNPTDVLDEGYYRSLHCDQPVDYAGIYMPDKLS